MALSKITSNSLSAFSSANTNFDNGTLFIDAQNNRIGIRTTIPGTNAINGSTNTLDASVDYALDIRGNMRLGSVSQTEQDIHFYAANNNTWQLGTNSAGTDVGSAHNNLFYLYNDNFGNGSNRATNRYYWTVDGDGQMRVPNQHGFHAYRSATVNPGANGTIIYDNIWWQRGGGYSTSTGRYTAKVAGTYLFMVTNNSWQTSGDLLLRKNGSNLSGLEFDPSGSGGWLGSSTQAIVQLNAGEYVDCIYTVSATYAVEGHPWNSFYGCLLH